MRVQYKGKDPDYDYRIAEISYDDENKKEEAKLYELADIMDNKGWKIDFVTNGYALCPVEDHDDFKSFMEDWSDAKKEYKERIQRHNPDNTYQNNVKAESGEIKEIDRDEIAEMIEDEGFCNTMDYLTDEYGMSADDADQLIDEIEEEYEIERKGGYER